MYKLNLGRSKSRVFIKTNYQIDDEIILESIFQKANPPQN